MKGKKPRAIIEFISDNSEHQWIVSPEILAEYKEVLNRRKFTFTDEVRQEWLTKVDTIPKIINVSREVIFHRDQKDAKFISCVLVSQADFLITGDRDFNDIQEIGKTMIISVSLFNELFIKG